MQGQSVISANILPALLTPSETPSADFELTDRELEVLRAIAVGLGNAEIAKELAISVSTVRFHLRNVLEKMGVESRYEALVIAAKANLL